MPIPGTKRGRYLDENLAAADLALAAGDLATLDEAVPGGAAAARGTRRRACERWAR